MNILATSNIPQPFKPSTLPAHKAAVVTQMGTTQADARPTRMPRRIDDHALFVYARNAEQQAPPKKHQIDEFV